MLPLFTMVLPSFTGPDLGQQGPDPLVVGRVEPEHPFEDSRSLIEAAETPEAKAEAMHAAQKRTIVDATPWQKTIEIVTQRQLADANARLVMTYGLLGPVLESEVAQVRMGIETAEVSRKHLEKELLCPVDVASCASFVSVEYRVAVKVLRIRAG